MLLHNVPIFFEFNSEGNKKTDVHERVLLLETQHMYRRAHRQMQQLYLFGLIISWRHIDPLPGNKLPNASSVVLISQSIQEWIEGGRCLRQDGSDL